MDLVNLIQPEFVILVFFLVGLGAVLKYYVDPLNNRLIPVVLFVVAFFISACSGYVFGVATGWAKVYESLITHGLLHGGSATAIAVFGWDIFHGLYKYGVEKEKK